MRVERIGVSVQILYGRAGELHDHVTGLQSAEVCGAAGANSREAKARQVACRHVGDGAEVGLRALTIAGRRRRAGGPHELEARRPVGDRARHAVGEVRDAGRAFSIQFV